MTYHWFRSVALAMALVMTAVSLPLGKAQAAFVPTEEGLARKDAEIAATRAQLSALMARDDVQEELRRLGVDPVEAAARVSALSDEEVAQVSDKLGELPAGQDGLAVVLSVLLTVFLVLLLTDLLGLTHIFPFVNRR